MLVASGGVYSVPSCTRKTFHAGAFADVAVRVEGDAFGVAVEAGFHADELRVHVVGGGFGHGGKRIGGDAGPGADADVDTFSESFRAKVGSPGPASHINVDRGAERIDADFAVTAKNDGLDVAGVEFVQAHNFGGGVAEIVDRVGKIHPIDLGGVDQALHMLAQPEDGRALLGFVAANAFKDRGAVADDMESTWSVASSQLMNFPLYQILSVLVMGICAPRVRCHCRIR